jgi:hypothetical protein
MGMGAQNRGATGVPAPTQMAMQGGAAPQGLMALMQQRGKGAGMPGGQMDPGMMQMMQRLQGNVPQPAQQTGGMMPPGMAAPGTNQPDPQMLAAMQAFQQQGGQGGMPAAGVDPRLGAMQVSPDQIRPLDPRMVAPGGIRFMDNLQAPTIPGEPLAPIMPGAPGKGAGMGMPRPQVPTSGKGGGMPTRPGLPSTMVNPARPRRNDSGPSQAERTRMMAKRTGPSGRGR